MSQKAYFNLKDFFNETLVDTGYHYQVDMDTLKVNGVEQLTAAYFAETTRLQNVYADAVNPHTGNVFEYSKCTQSGSYPNPTAFNQCALAGSFNSYNPFAHFFKVNYSDTVDGVKRGEIVNSVSGSVYGLEPFGFGFDKTYVPINDAIGGQQGSTGASVDGAFWLNIDYTKDLLIDINITKWDTGGNKIWWDIHTIKHTAGDCKLEVTLKRLQFYAFPNSVPLEDVTQLGHLSGGLSGWLLPECSSSVEVCPPLVEGDHNFTTAGTDYQWLLNGANGFIYGIPWIETRIMKINPADLSVTYLPDVIPQAYYTVGKLAPNGKIYCPPRTGDNVMIIDTATDLVSFIAVPAPLDAGERRWETADIDSNGIMFSPPSYAASPAVVQKYWLKIDTNTDTVTQINPVVGTIANYDVSIMSSADKLYCFSRTSGVPILEYDVANDNIANIGTSTAEFRIKDAPFESNNGNIYVLGSDDVSNNPKMVKIPVATGLMSEIDLGFTFNRKYASLKYGADGNIWAIPYSSANYERFDDVTEQLTGDLISLPLTASFKTLGASANDDDGNIISTSWISFAVNPTSAGYSVYKQSFPPCGDEPSEPICDCITSISLGILAAKRREKIVLFEVDKTCCYYSPVVGDLSDPVSYKNDINGFLFKRGFSSETIDYVLLKNGGNANGGADIPMVNNDYGTYYNFGGFANYPDYKGYQVDWRKVLALEGEGDYQIRVTSNLVTGTFVDVSIPFQLRAYTAECVLGTVRIQSVMDGYLRYPDFDYKGLNWLDGIRFAGMFGNRQAEYEEERIIYNNRQVKQLRSELINKYNLKTMHLPSCITDVILQYHNLSNKMIITDYNNINHKVYVETEVILDSVNAIEYAVVANTAPLDITYKDYTQNHNKSNC